MRRTGSQRLNYNNSRKHAFLTESNNCSVPMYLVDQEVLVCAECAARARKGSRRLSRSETPGLRATHTCGEFGAVNRE